MEIILAVVVVLAVIFFGALISLGNERQRKSIDALHEQIIHWAMQDLRIKREKLKQDVRVDDPVAWLNKVVSKIIGYDPNIQVVETFNQPPMLNCTYKNGGGRLLFSPLSPKDLLTMSRRQHNKLHKYADRNPLLSLPRDAKVYELSILNTHIIFDLELPLAWEALTGNVINQSDTIWMYMLS